MDEASNFVYSFFVSYNFIPSHLKSRKVSLIETHLPLARFLSCVLLLFSLEKAVSSERILSRSVAMVGKQVLTSREVRALTLLEAALNERPLGKNNSSLSSNNSLETLLGKLTVDDVNAEIFEVILSQEAEVFAFNQISNNEMTQKLEKVKKNLKSQDEWSKLEISEVEILRLLRLKLIAKAYLNFKTTTLSGQVSDAETLAYFEKNKDKFAGLPFEQMKVNIKSFLSQQQMQDRLKSYFDAMKRKYKARNMLSEQGVE